MTKATTLQLLGAGGFGTLIGWYIYYVSGIGLELAVVPALWVWQRRVAAAARTAG